MEENKNTIENEQEQKDVNETTNEQEKKGYVVKMFEFIKNNKKPIIAGIAAVGAVVIGKKLFKNETEIVQEILTDDVTKEVIEEVVSEVVDPE